MIYYILGIISLLITAIAQIYISVTYSKYSQVKSKNKLSGFETAKKILEKNNLEKLYVVETQGTLTDHYDPRAKVVRLSHDIFNGDSISSIAVAAHECGHAIQDKENYTFLRIRASLVPFVNLSSRAGYVAILLGLLFGYLNLIWIGIVFELVILLFQIVTLPVEINASAKALKELDNTHILNSNELKSSKKVLTAAAMTYIASVASAILQILRLILMFGRNND